MRAQPTPSIKRRGPHRADPNGDGPSPPHRLPVSKRNSVPKASLDADQEEQFETQREALHEALAELESSRNQYAELYDRAPFGYLTLLPLGKIVGVNLTGAALLGYDREKLKGRLLHGFAASQADLKKVLDHLRRCRTGESTVKTSVQLKSLNGNLLRVDLVSHSQMDTAVKVFPTAIVDLTEQRKAEESLAIQARRSELLSEIAASLVMTPAPGEL